MNGKKKGKMKGKIVTSGTLVKKEAEASKKGSKTRGGGRGGIGKTENAR